MKVSYRCPSCIGISHWTTLPGPLGWAGQVLGALDLAPEDPEIWLEAAKAGCGEFVKTLDDLNIFTPT